MRRSARGLTTLAGNGLPGGGPSGWEGRLAGALFGRQFGGMWGGGQGLRGGGGVGERRDLVGVLRVRLGIVKFWLSTRGVGPSIVMSGRE